MEKLFDIIYRCGDIAPGRMPERIRHITDRPIRFRIQFTDFLVLDNISSPIRRTHMEHHLHWISHTERMAVHTIIASHIVTDNRLFVKRLQIPLINTHNMPFLVSRLYQTVY